MKSMLEHLKAFRDTGILYIEITNIKAPHSYEINKSQPPDNRSCTIWYCHYLDEMEKSNSLRECVAPKSIWSNSNTDMFTSFEADLTEYIEDALTLIRDPQGVNWSAAIPPWYSCRIYWSIQGHINIDLGMDNTVTGIPRLRLKNNNNRSNNLIFSRIVYIWT